MVKVIVPYVDLMALIGEGWMVLILIVLPVCAVIMGLAWVASVVF